MPNLRELRSRIKSVESTSRVTNALQMIAAAKMKKAQDKVLDGRSYGEKLNSILSNFYLSNREIFNSEDAKGDKNLIILVTPDRGLCGALVSNILKSASNYFENDNSDKEIVVIGKKGNSYISRTTDNEPAFYQVSDMPTFDEVSDITKFIIEKYSSGEFSEINIIYSEFISTAVQKAKIKKLMPIQIDEDLEEKVSSEFLYEPSLEEVSNALIPRYIEVNIFNAVLDSIASEHSARLVAMQNATDNANELKEDLTLDLNKARQQTVTSEILDIIGGALALE
tara:strand:+ start:2368 stop:3213 length:846 start_codon:yes stop_codon:yes gene_type:complete